MGDFREGGSRGPRREGGFRGGGHSGGSHGGGFRGGGRGGGGFRRDSGPREMHKATCAECGQECEVPFKPTEGREVFCKDCFAKRRQPRY